MVNYGQPGGLDGMFATLPGGYKIPNSGLAAWQSQQGTGGEPIYRPSIMPPGKMPPIGGGVTGEINPNTRGFDPNSPSGRAKMAWEGQRNSPRQAAMGSLRTYLQQSLGGSVGSGGNSAYTRLLGDRMLRDAEPRYAASMFKRGLQGSSAYASGLSGMISDINERATLRGEELANQQGSLGLQGQSLQLQANRDASNEAQQQWQNMFNERQYNDTATRNQQNDWLNYFTPSQRAEYSRTQLGTPQAGEQTRWNEGNYGYGSFTPQGLYY